jgi:hypothetical protein
MCIGSQRSRRKLTQRSYNSTRTRVTYSIPQVVSSTGPTPTLRIHVSHVVLMTAAAKVSHITATRVITSVHHNIMQAIASEAVNHTVSQDRAVQSIKHTIATLSLTPRPLVAAVASRVNLARKPMQPEVLVGQRQRFALTAWTARLQATIPLDAARTHITRRTQAPRHDIFSLTNSAHLTYPPSSVA